MDRGLFQVDHLIFRDSFRRFIEGEVAPFYEAWQHQGFVPKDIWKKAGERGFVCPGAKEEFGGLGADFLFATIISEELYAAGVPGFFLPLHSEICYPYIEQLASNPFKDEWIRDFISGEKILALAMTEPEAGSDLANLKTTAVLEGGHYRINGSKMFISNGQIADVFIVAVKTDPLASPIHHGISLIAVTSDCPGLKRGKNFQKIGLHAQDTSEIIFENCLVPSNNLLGEAGKGFAYMMQNLQQERLMIAISAVGAMAGCYRETMKYVKERKAFGKTLISLPTIRAELAEIATKIQVSQSFVDDLIRRHINHEGLMKEVSMAKYWTTDTQFEVADRCLQLFGGYGYMEEFPISRHFVDARVQRIYGGTNEIMKELIARELVKESGS